MQNRQVVMRARKYLCQFDEIRSQMAEKMLSQKTSNSITIDFIQCMIPHHQAAIEMSQNLLQYTTYQPLQKMANDIICKQTEEIQEMEEMLKSTYGFPNMPQEVNNYRNEYLRIVENMIEKMKNAPKSIYINLDFTYEMIPHHKGAIEMCENLLKYRMDAKLKVMADFIIKEQSKGVQELQQIQKKLSGKK